MQPSTIQPLGHTVPCSTIITGSNTPSASSATSLIPGCLMQTPGTLTPLGMINNPHMGLIMQQNHQQQQQQQQQLMAQEQQQHQPNSMIPMTDPSFPVTSTPPIPVSTTARMSGFDSGGGSSGIVAVSQTFTPINNPSLVSLFGKPPKPRTESFAFDEVKILLQEIELRKHVLLSISHSMNRYKRRAWEEVAASMATRCPYGPRRTADQVKKKWENLVSKTKQKLRSGRITAESDWSDVNTAVLEFLAHHNPFLRMRYATAAASILSSNNDDDGKHAKETATITTDFMGLTRMYDSQMQSLGLPGLGGPLGLDHQLQQQQPQNSVIMIKEEVRSVSSAEMNADEEPIDSLQALETKSSANGGDVHNADNRYVRQLVEPSHWFSIRSPPVTILMGLPDAVGGPKLVCNLGPEHNRLLVDQLTKEHSARMELLQLQKRAWQLQVDLLQRSLSTDESGES
ncbi:Leucine rich repeat containing protein LRR [Fasciola gigantica]|uniref:Leucine rich repeat containing protein LRR n=1 Tax=Fasciola gigantica TaxID=46835 RepID=A0A504YTH0_FASGI|nr:Leucine rich repeat containing protein LRR [Fasciola gigantica]